MYNVWSVIILTKLVCGITGWLLSLAKIGIEKLGILVSIIINISCLIHLPTEMIQKILHRILIVEKQKGGNVGTESAAQLSDIEEFELCP